MGALFKDGIPFCLSICVLTKLIHENSWAPGFRKISMIKSSLFLETPLRIALLFWKKQKWCNCIFQQGVFEKHVMICYLHLWRQKAESYHNYPHHTHTPNRSKVNAYSSFKQCLTISSRTQNTSENNGDGTHVQLISIYLLVCSVKSTIGLIPLIRLSGNSTQRSFGSTTRQLGNFCGKWDYLKLALLPRGIWGIGSAPTLGSLCWTVC